MKFVSEYRDPKLARHYADAIAEVVTQPWTIEEICGGQTHTIVKYGIDRMLPDLVTLVHGPGCPVCVTPIEIIDRAISIARHSNAILCSFGDMLRVPGTQTDLLSVKATGGQVQIVYSPLDALEIARNNREREVVFFAVGFETTAPATAMSVYQAAQQNLTNFSLLVSHVLVPPAMEAILSAPQCRVQGFLAAGHVCTVMGYTEYEPIVEKYQIPIVVTGFEPVDILQGIYLCLQQLENGESKLENQYARSVSRMGNQTARDLMSQVFEVIPRRWRGLGEISQSGLGLRSKYAAFDADRKFGFDIDAETAVDETECISGEILQGLKKPHECPAFGTRCTPEHPLGAPMVSSEGACAAYYRWRRGVEAVASV
ncbi:MAG: hydrogenase formation protein HypD [Cyanobacteria bacterium SID2]|nr:hydrogenase formation protein HypD [Cyanobacteria bacterium SID2]MBP0004493.1 hydrogenase formation protein HypD [Cyanobacteria bacterium SBC]